MSIRWTEAHEALRAEFAAWYETLSAIPHEADFAERWATVRESGLLRLPFDQAYGGRGLDLLSTMYVLEGLGEGCRDAGLSFSLVTQLVSAAVPLQQFGSASLKQRYLRRICSGELVTGHAITDPAGGSDVLGMRMTAERDGDHWVLHGAKSFVTNGPVASLFIVYAVTDRSAGPLGLTAFAMERDTPGLRIGTEPAKLGLASSPMCDLAFNGCRVPDADVVGGQGRGFLVLNRVMAWEVLCSFIVTVGEMRHRLSRCIDYARERHQFGFPIGSFQAVANRIVEMKIGVETSRRWLYETAAGLAGDEDVAADLAISKLLASEANVASALHAVQIFGGAGYLTQTGLEQGLRDAVAGTVYSGTSEVQRERIARLLGLGTARDRHQPASAAGRA